MALSHTHLPEIWSSQQTELFLSSMENAESLAGGLKKKAGLSLEGIRLWDIRIRFGKRNVSEVHKLCS